jgi:thiamine monophosphate synthase
MIVAKVTVEQGLDHLKAAEDVRALCAGSNTPVVVCRGVESALVIAAYKCCPSLYVVEIRYGLSEDM